jgi:hypothetical protein
VRQHQNAAARQACQLGDDQAFTRAGWQDDCGRFMMATKPGERGVDGLFW